MVRINIVLLDNDDGQDKTWDIENQQFEAVRFEVKFHTILTGHGRVVSNVLYVPTTFQGYNHNYMYERHKCM